MRNAIYTVAMCKKKKENRKKERKSKSLSFEDLQVGVIISLETELGQEKEEKTSRLN